MDRPFETPEQPVAHMREVAVKRSGFSNWLGVEPVKTWEGEPEHTQHDSPAPVLIPATMRVAGLRSGAAHKSI